MTATQLLKHFLRKVHKTQTCWLWTGALVPSGHGLYWIDRKGLFASRASWILHYGEILPGLLVCHRCSNPACVRPSHLYLGTRSDNRHDGNRRAPGTVNRGTYQPRKHHPSFLMPCRTCQQPFRVQVSRLHRNPQYCSQECARTQKPSITLLCRRCQTPFVVFYYRREKAKYCSMECSQRGMIWNKIDTSGGPDACWEFLGHKSSKGYGTKTRLGKTSTVHRFIYSETYGEIPEGKQINHRCNNRACVNPTHLYAGTTHDNTMDAIRSGRYRTVFVPGAQHAMAKLTEVAVREIRAQQGKNSTQALAQQYGVSPKTIRDIWQGKSWRHLRE